MCSQIINCNYLLIIRRWQNPNWWAERSRPYKSAAVLYLPVKNYEKYQDAVQVPVLFPGCDDHLHPGRQGSGCRLSFRKIWRSLCRLGQWDLPSCVQGGRTSQWTLQPQSEVLVRRMLRHQFLKIFFKVCSALQKPNI